MLDKKTSALFQEKLELDFGAIGIARSIYRQRVRDLANVRAEKFIAFGKMQSSRLVQPNQSDLQALVQKLQALDFEIKRTTDLVFAASVLLAYEEDLSILENLQQFRSVASMAAKCIIESTSKNLETTDPEEVVAVTLFRDLYMYLPALYPGQDLIARAEAARAAACENPYGKSSLIIS